MCLLYVLCDLLPAVFMSILFSEQDLTVSADLLIRSYKEFIWHSAFHNEKVTLQSERSVFMLLNYSGSVGGNALQVT